jgi:hypothetical protein
MNGSSSPLERSHHPAPKPKGKKNEKKTGAKPMGMEYTTPLWNFEEDGNNTYTLWKPYTGRKVRSPANNLILLQSNVS